MLSDRILDRLVQLTPARPWSAKRSAAVAAACVLAAFVGRLLLDPLLGDNSPFALFLLAVVAIGYFCGGLYAAAATVVSVFICLFFFLSPRYSLAAHEPYMTPVVVFVVLCAVLAGAAVLLRAAVVALAARRHELEMAGERARRIANLSPQIVWSARRDGVPDYYNDRWYEYSGANPDVAPTGWDPFVHPDDVEEVSARWAHALKTGERYEAEMRLRGHDGEYRWFIARALPLEDRTGKITRWYGTCTDIHDARTSIEKLQALKLQLEQSENRFREIADLSPQITWSTLPDGHHDYYNKRWYEFTGVPEGSTDGEGWNGMFHPEDQPLAWEKWSHSLKIGEPYEIEYRLRRHDGEYLWFLGRALPMRDAQGNIVRWFGTCTDIHDRKMALAMMETLSHELSHRIKNIFAV
ncbi:MAG: PAS domain-containing protein, partial [Gemmatimonadaceae bacterium]|nr:PAS domain-containing protein [Gemmatimonadaceae bacterium]